MILNNQPYEQKERYMKLLQAVCSLSRLFSDSTVPALYYRAAENIFCKAFKADNLARSDAAYDAKIADWGIGLKTFVSKKGNSIEKIAEFNKLSGELTGLSAYDLACKLASFRNERIKVANRIYGVKQAIYHCVAREDNKLKLFEVGYQQVNINGIKKVKETKAGISFHDGINEYSFNASKSTLFKRFITPKTSQEVAISIIEDPYELLLGLIGEAVPPLEVARRTAGAAYVILPLYASRSNPKQIPERSGINQWNAKGRPRDAGEIYIPVPKPIHTHCQGFFPDRDTPFSLIAPTGEVLSAKLCQDGSKALMTNPNNALSDWLLRKVIGLEERQLAVYRDLEVLGFDSVKIIKVDNNTYKIDVADLDEYELFLDQIIASS